MRFVSGVLAVLLVTGSGAAFGIAIAERYPGRYISTAPPLATRAYFATLDVCAGRAPVTSRILPTLDPERSAHEEKSLYVYRYTCPDGTRGAAYQSPNAAPVNAGDGSADQSMSPSP